MIKKGPIYYTSISDINNNLKSDRLVKKTPSKEDKQNQQDNQNQSNILFSDANDHSSNKRKGKKEKISFMNWVNKTRRRRRAKKAIRIDYSAPNTASKKPLKLKMNLKKKGQEWFNVSKNDQIQGSERSVTFNYGKQSSINVQSRRKRLSIKGGPE